jgi:hypothetical protein
VPPVVDVPAVDEEPAVPEPVPPVPDEVPATGRVLVPATGRVLVPAVPLPPAPPELLPAV